MKRSKRARSLWGPSVAATGWGESTFAELQWDKSRRASQNWAIAGVVIGTLIALIAFAPAAWLASAVASATAQRVVLGDARGTVWNGSATLVLSGGEGSRDAAALPGRLGWTMRPHGLGLEMQLDQACCLNGRATVRIAPGFSRTIYTLVPAAGWIGQWPTALLGGLGTPWNTMQLGGLLRLDSPGIKVVATGGRYRVEGRAELLIADASSRLSTLEPLGSYRVTLTGDAAAPDASSLALATVTGPLQLSGSGTLGSGGLRFRGEARAASDDLPALANLLNIIGRRSGARSVISIG